MPSNEPPIALHDAAVARQEPKEISLIQVIAQAASDPRVDVAKMQALLDMKERIEGREAETEFNRCMKAAQQEMRPVVRDRKNPSTGSMYAQLETVDSIIRPIYTKHGFSLTFNSAAPVKPGNLRVLCSVLHDGGHSKQYELEGDLDTAGPQGKANKTGIQGLGSSASYLRRYLTLLIFNVALRNEDNDGNNNPLTPEEANNITDMLNACDIKPGATMKAFLEFAGATSPDTIQRHRYADVLAMLQRKLKKLREEGK